MSPAEREACILDALGILPAVARQTGVSRIRHQPVADLEDYRQVGAEAIVKAADLYDPHRGAAFGTYAFEAARQAMIDEARRLRWRRQANPQPGRILVPLSDDTAPTEWFADTTFDDIDLRYDLAAAVDQLPVDQQTVVRLYYLEGLDQAQVGQRLGITQSAVSLRLTAARAALRERLAA